jgi:uncharacterized protein YndB with AHSA1/START domain
MPDIFHDFPIAAPLDAVFRAVSTGQGLAHWWTERSSGSPQPGAEYELGFGPQHDWRARVSQCVPFGIFELEFTRADADWLGTRVGFRLSVANGSTQVHFHHLGWPQHSDHYRTSCYCWAMYLRILKRYLEHGEEVPYDQRLDV